MWLSTSISPEEFVNKFDLQCKLDSSCFVLFQDDAGFNEEALVMSSKKILVGHTTSLSCHYCG